MEILKSNKGIALILALILGLVSIAFLAGIFLMISTGARMSGIERSYTAAVEAARGGATLTCRYLRRGITNSQLAKAAEEGWLTVDWDCLQVKRSKATAEWASWGCDCDETDDTSCETDDTLSSIKDYNDLEMTVGTYRLYSKVIDTKKFTTVTGETGYIYTVHVLSESTQDCNDKAWITFLYRVEP